MDKLFFKSVKEYFSQMLHKFYHRLKVESGLFKEISNKLLTLRFNSEQKIELEE